MLYLTLSVLFSTLNHLLFKAFPRFRIEVITALVVNYGVCVLIGYGSTFQTLINQPIHHQGWFIFSIIQGALLVTCLFLIAWTTEKQGVTVASLASRLSVALPTIAAFFLYGDLVTMAKILGIIMALAAIFLNSIKPKNSLHTSAVISFLPISLFIGFGIHSALMKHVQYNYLGDTTYHSYVMSSFLFAFIITLSILIWKKLKENRKSNWKDIVAGFVLGCSNYGSVYFLIRTLGITGWESSTIFPTQSVAIIIFSSLSAWLLFKEEIRKHLIIAILIGTLSIVLVNL